MSHREEVKSATMPRDIRAFERAVQDTAKADHKSRQQGRQSSWEWLGWGDHRVAITGAKNRLGFGFKVPNAGYTAVLHHPELTQESDLLPGGRLHQRLLSGQLELALSTDSYAVPAYEAGLAKLMHPGGAYAASVIYMQAEQSGLSWETQVLADGSVEITVDAPEQMVDWLTV